MVLETREQKLDIVGPIQIITELLDPSSIVDYFSSLVVHYLPVVDVSSTNSNGQKNHIKAQQKQIVMLVEPLF
jgi:hypothetical protein